MNIIPVLSPNFTQGRRTYRPEAIVIHVMDGTLKGTDGWFSSPLSQVSAHYGIGRNGEVHQYVEEIDTAWHAGRIHDPTWPLINKALSLTLYRSSEALIVPCEFAIVYKLGVLNPSDVLALFECVL